jgi:monooxygenase
MSEHFDVIIVGAGLSGIGAACHLAAKCPGKTVAILEGRDAIGGTWDLFRYPGIRSDSDMHTLGYSFKPWIAQKAIADGPSILEYVREAAREHGIDSKIRFRHRVKRASWSSERASWTVEAERGEAGEIVRFTCSFLFMCAGYYDYEKGHTPEFEGMDRYEGRIVHPQKWPRDIDYRDKKVIVIGSGATAITLVPAMAKDAAHVVMLQRSPTYVLSLPSTDPIARWLRRFLPAKAAYEVTRWKNVLFGMAIYELCRRRPEGVKKRLLGLVREQLGPDYDVEKHFSPRYNPWDQRLCLAADADLFEALKSGKASVVTDQIERFTEKGIRLASGQELSADLVVMATGLRLMFLGGMEVSVDGRRVDPGKLLSYKGVMLSDVPNLAVVIGYTNASWTLKADLICEYVCRLLSHMDRIGARQCTPRRDGSEVGEMPLLPLASGYIQRGIASLPKQGSQKPWKVNQNYLRDIFMLRLGEVDDGTMEFDTAPLGARSTSRGAENVARPGVNESVGG